MKTENLKRKRAWRPEIRGFYDRFRGAFEETGLLDDLIRMLNCANEMLVVVDECGLHPVMARTLILGGLEMIHELARAYAGHVGATMMKHYTMSSKSF